MAFISRLADLAWSPAIIIAFLAAGVWVSAKLGFYQFRFRRWIGGMASSELDSKGRVSPWRAAATALGGALGTGNISGVAWAVALGGPGAIFWMWVSAAVGMGLSYAEKALTLIHIKERAGGPIGGAMCYIEKALGKKAGVFYALVCIAAIYTGGCMTQSRAMCSAVACLVPVKLPILGLCAAGALWAVSKGGIERTSSISAVLVPFVSLLYMGVGFAALGRARHSLPDVFASIFRSAFDMHPAAAGVSALSAMRHGFARGIFSSEAGVGSSTIPHASAHNSPHGQGCWGIFEVFLDTVVICTLTGLIILSSPAALSNPAGEGMTAAALSGLLGGFAPHFVALCITVLAFSTLISRAWCAKQCIRYLSKGKDIAKGCDICFCAAVFLGTFVSPRTLWDASDALNVLLALPNLAALCLFSEKAALCLPKKASNLKKIFFSKK